MSWLDWFKARGGRAAQSAAPAVALTPKKVSGSTPSRRARLGANAYAEEWVRVLEDSAPGRDPFGTYAWELDTDSRPQPPPGGGAVKPPVVDFAEEPPNPDAQAQAASEADPWGLGEAAQQKAQAGVNPYDTGVFHSGWGDRSKAR